LAAKIYAHAAPVAGFKNCCMLSGEFDGVERKELDRKSVV
jgi:hypothetical protein